MLPRGASSSKGPTRSVDHRSHKLTLNLCVCNLEQKFRGIHIHITTPGLGGYIQQHVETYNRSNTGKSVRDSNDMAETRGSDLCVAKENDRATRAYAHACIRRSGTHLRIQKTLQTHISWLAKKLGSKMPNITFNPKKKHGERNISTPRIIRPSSYTDRDYLACRCSTCE